MKKGNDKAKAEHVSLFIYWGTYLKAHSDGLLCFSCVKRIKLEKIISTAFYASELCRSNGSLKSLHYHHKRASQSMWKTMVRVKS